MVYQGIEGLLWQADDQAERQICKRLYNQYGIFGVTKLMDAGLLQGWPVDDRLQCAGLHNGLVCSGYRRQAKGGRGNVPVQENFCLVAIAAKLLQVILQRICMKKQNVVAYDVLVGTVDGGASFD